MAVAFDAISFGAIEPGASFTFSHTTTGDNRVLLVCVAGEAITGTSVTYNSVSLTLLTSEATGGESRIWGLLNPASGANTVAVNFAEASKYVRAHAISYTGVLQSGLPDASQNNVGSGASPLTSTITTVANNCWAVIHAANYDGNTLTASTNVTRRDATNRAYLLVGDNNADISPAGNLSQTVTYTTGTGCRLLQVSLAPAPAAAAVVGGNYAYFM